MMNKKWTKQIPNETGFYFVRWDEEGLETVVSVYKDPWDESEDMLIATLSEDCHYILDDEVWNKFDDAEWLGPIKPEHFLK